MLEKCVLSSFLNMAGLAAARMSGSSEFHAAGPACEKERSPNLVRRRVHIVAQRANRYIVAFRIAIS